MNKQKITLPTSKWGTLKTKYRPESNYVSDNEFTAGSHGFVTNDSGAIEKGPTDVIYNTGAFSSTPKDQFEAIFSTGVHHLLVMDGGTLKYSTGNRAFTTVTAGFTSTASMEYSMYQNRVYMGNGIDNPTVYDLTPSYGGVSYSIPQTKQMGAIPPASAATFNSDGAGGSVPVGGHTYVTTFLYYGDEESNGGTVSSLHTVSGGSQTVNLKTIPVGGYGVTARNIYRDNNDGNYILVGTLSNNTATTFVDSVSAGTTPLPASNNLPPIFSYITLNLSRNWVAGVPGTPSVLYWSLPGLPDIFDPNNFSVCNPKDPIVGVVTFQGVTTVLNRHSFGKILGTTDDTFYYDEVPGTVGCVDNRSIQVRTIDGVPVLVWLSDRGFYKFDGSSVTYISDPIEDIVNFNLQQVSFTTGSNSQSTQADYAGGTASPSIDIGSNPGTITVLNPKKVFQSRADWEGGSSLTNVSTADGTNQLKVPTAFSPSIASGALSGGAVVSGANLVLPTSADFTGDNSLSGATPRTPAATPCTDAAQPIIPLRSGTLTDLFIVAQNMSSLSGVIQLMVWSDVLGSPGTVLYTGSNQSVTGANPGTTYVEHGISISMVAGTKYWVGFHNVSGSTVIEQENRPVFSAGASKVKTGTSWINATDSSGNASSAFYRYDYASSPLPASGAWTSPVFDSFSIGSAATNHVVNTGSFPTSCSGTLYVDESNDSGMSTGVTTFSQANPNGTYSPSLSGNRYWRLRYALATTDNRRTPSVTAPALNFSTTGTWISQPIDCTTDITSYAPFSITENLPAGTSATITVATSADNSTYSSFGPIGSAVVHRWVKVKIELTAKSDDTTTPSVSFLQLSWAQSSTFTSSIVDVGQVPTGWGVFQNASATNSGTLSFYMRSASSSGGIAAASFFAVSNGVFPPTGVSPLEFTQWKIVFTSAADSLPAVSGVTINWFIGTAQSPIRAASLFFNKTYYLSAATKESPTNNIVLVWDFENSWRVFTGVTINSLGLFYNEPFYCDGARNNVYQWLIAPTGEGSAISMDVRTKAFDLGNNATLKNVRSLRVTGINTGTTIHAYYSIDRGTTWVEMLNVQGTTGFVTTTSGSKFSQYFAADYSGSSAVSGTTVMFRVASTDAFPCVIMQLEPVLYSRNGKYLEIPI